MAYLNKIKQHSIPIIGILIVVLGIIFTILYVTREFGYKHLESPSKVLRLQTHALLRGDLALSDTIKDLKYDMVWHNNSVSQVWGLGVPLLRIPFFTIPEGIIHIIYFGLSLFIAGIAGYAFCRRFKCCEYGVLVPLILCCVGLFPPVLLLMKSRFVVYEEVITYGYFFCCALFFLLLAYYTYPRNKILFYSICLFGGYAGLIRPTLYAYAVPIVCIALYYGWKHLSHRSVYIGVFLVSIGGMSLLITNHIRFGSMLEFGHHVNVALDVSSVNLTRFESAYTTETSFIDKMQETFGILFLIDEVPQPNGLYMDNQTPFQTEAIRWRHIVFPTIHWYYLGAFIALGIVAWRQRSLLFIVPCVSFTVLFIFYSHSYIISSRYLIDFAASFVIASTLALLYAYQSHSIMKKVLVTSIIAGIYMYGAYADMSFVPDDPAIRRTAFVKKEIQPELPDMYQVGSEPGYSEFNGAGWSSSNGTVRAAVIFFVDNPQFIELSFKCSSVECMGFEKNVNAILDGKNLENRSIDQVGSSTVIRFEVKKTSPPDSVETLFIQTFFIRDSMILPSLVLEHVRWK